MGSLAAFTVLVLASSCAKATGGATGDPPETSRAPAVMQRAGCAACHGTTGQGGVGPSFVGLAGSDVVLSDGSVVIADYLYLVESIRTPGAKRVAGFSVEMPTITLTDDEIAEVVAYIHSLEIDGG